MFDEPATQARGAVTPIPGFGNPTSGDGYNGGASPKASSAGLPIEPALATPPPMFGAQTSGVNKKPVKKSPGSFMGSNAMIPMPSQLGSATLTGQ